MADGKRCRVRFRRAAVPHDAIAQGRAAHGGFWYGRGRHFRRLAVQVDAVDLPCHRQIIGFIAQQAPAVKQAIFTVGIVAITVVRHVMHNVIRRYSQMWGIVHWYTFVLGKRCKTRLLSLP